MECGNLEGDLTLTDLRFCLLHIRKNLKITFWIVEYSEIKYLFHFQQAIFPVLDHFYGNQKLCKIFCPSF